MCRLECSTPKNSLRGRNNHTAALSGRRELSSNLNPTFLRIVRFQNKFSGFYSSNGLDWVLIGDKIFPIADPVDVGLDVIIAYGAETFFADFDYFKVYHIQTPTLDISCKGSTSFSGFSVEVQGSLTFNGTAVSNAPILLSFSATGGKSWDDLTLTKTSSDGSYSVMWNPSVIGDYLVKATYEGGDKYTETTASVNLAVTQHAEKNVFSVNSNSNMSNLAFNSTSKELSFTVEGESGTLGYADVYIAKTLIQDATSIEVRLDGNKMDYTTISEDDSWLVHFTYSHSTHKVTINLGSSAGVVGGLLGNWMVYGIIAAIIVVVAVAVFVIIRKTKNKKRSS